MGVGPRPGPAGKTIVDAVAKIIEDDSPGIIAIERGVNGLSESDAVLGRSSGPDPTGFPGPVCAEVTSGSPVVASCVLTAEDDAWDLVRLRRPVGDTGCSIAPIATGAALAPPAMPIGWP